jgi:hypothetical protein
MLSWTGDLLRAHPEIALFLALSIGYAVGLAVRRGGNAVHHDPADDDGQHADGDAAIEVFAKQEPRKKRGEDALEIEQQRCRRGRCGRQSNINLGPSMPPNTIAPAGTAHRGATTSDFRAMDRHAPRRHQDCRPRRPCVQSGQHDRRHFADETLGQRRADAEQRGGSQGEGNT